MYVFFQTSNSHMRALSLRTVQDIFSSFVRNLNHIQYHTNIDVYHSTSVSLLPLSITLSFSIAKYFHILLSPHFIQLSYCCIYLYIFMLFLVTLAVFCCSKKCSLQNCCLQENHFPRRPTNLLGFFNPVTQGPLPVAASQLSVFLLIQFYFVLKNHDCWEKTDKINVLKHSMEGNTDICCSCTDSTCYK